MKFLEHFLDSKKHLFEQGGKLEKLYPVYEAIDTFAFTPASVTQTTAHVRDGIDLKRTMITVVVAMIPCILMALYNTGYQAHLVMEAGQFQAVGWRHDLMMTMGLPHDPANLFSSSQARRLGIVPGGDA